MLRHTFKYTLILLGLSHAGKTTSGKLLAALLGCPFYDTDALIQLHTGLTPRELCRRDGVSALHRAEAAALRSCCAAVQDGSAGEAVVSSSCAAQKDRRGAAPVAYPNAGAPPSIRQNLQKLAVSSSAAVIAAGGGIGDNQEAAALLAAIPHRIFLYASESVLFDRLTQDAQRAGCYPAFLQLLPAAQYAAAQQLFSPLYARRTEYYRKCCTLCIDTSHLTAVAVAQAIAAECMPYFPCI